MVDIYTKLNETYLHSENETPFANYDPQEPSLARLKQRTPITRQALHSTAMLRVVVISRPTAESKDYLPRRVAEGTGASEPLELTTNERDVIETQRRQVIRSSS